MRKKKEAVEPAIIRREYSEDDEYYIETDYTNFGAKIINRHPKHPEKPKEEVLAEVAPILLDAWYNLQKRKRSEQSG